MTYYYMIKVVAKSPPDPVQAKLRESKKTWNKQVSEFADNLFRLKDMMNGKPSKFHQEKSSIKDPIPGDPVTIIGVLVGDFQEIAQQGNNIVRQQLEYSKTRRKKQPKQTLAPLPMSPKTPANDISTTNLSKQLAAEAEVYEMVALGSNIVSRFFTRLLTPTVGSSPQARTRKYRMSLLESSVEIYKDLITLQATIVESSPESIFTASRLLSKISGNWEFFKTGIITYKESDTKPTPKDSGGPISSKEDGREEAVQDLESSVKDRAPIEQKTEPKDKSKEVPQPAPSISADAIVEDYKKYSTNFTDINLKNLTSLIGIYRVAKNLYKLDVAKQLETEYNSVIQKLNSIHGTSGKSFREIFEMKKAKAQYSVYKLESVGQQLIQRWIAKLKHQLSPLDKTSAHRLDIYKAAESSRKMIDSIMDSLEKEMNSDHILKLGETIDINFKVMDQLMSGLESTLRGKNFDNTFMDLLNDNKITNFGPNLNPKQREHLQRMIDRRRIREFTDLYQGRR